jgi:glycosyltransferase involved in cell wall biosynthesis
VRHIYFAFKSLWAYLKADKVIVLDTWSVALPIAMLAFVFRKKFIIRTGGDFLWESYVERTRKKILLKDFYIHETESFSRKERFIFNATQWIIRMADKVIFSTAWQKDIWWHPYHIHEEKTKIVENYIGQRFTPVVPKGKYFVASVRPLAWKNTEALKSVFEDKEVLDAGVRLDSERVEHDKFMDKIASSYAVILVSLGDISPNMILDAVRCGKPFICTTECGLYEKLKGIGLWVDPLNKEEIKEAVLWLADENHYQDQCIKVAAFRDVHEWGDIAKEILAA